MPGEPPAGGSGPPNWLEGDVLFARFWMRFGLAVCVMLAAVALAGAGAGWSDLHEWTNALVLAGLLAWALALLLLLLLSVAGMLPGRKQDDAGPPAAVLLPYSLVLAFGGLVPLGLGVGLAALLA